MSPAVAAGRASSPASEDVRVSARVLGGFELLAGGRPIARADWQRLSAERLVKLLLVTPGHRLTREAAAETLWPDAAPQASRANLRKALHFASHALDGTGLIVADSANVALAGDRLDLDLDRLQAALDVLAAARPVHAGPSSQGASADHDAHAEALAVAADVALDLASSQLLPDDLYEDWLVGPRERLLGRWQRLALPAARREAERGHLARAHEIVARVLERDMTDEAAHRLAIELYAAEGRHHAARRQYAICRSELAAALDVEPSPDTEETFARAERSARAARPAAPAANLVARQAELQRIEPLLDRVTAGRPASLIVRGPAGIGKTRLLQEVAAYARAGGWSTIEWQAVESSTALAFAPFRVGLVRLVDPDDARRWDEPARSAFAALAPGLGRGSVRFAAQAALVAGLVAVVDHLARGGPLLFAIDDFPWLDGPSKEVLQAVMSGLSDRPILLAMTLRDGELLAEGTVRLADDLRRGESLELSLTPLAARDLERLILGHLGGEAVGGDVLRQAYEQSEGNPLFCLELVRLWQDRGHVRLEDGRWTVVSGVPPRSLPATVRRLVERRTAEVPAETQELLAIAAEMGPEIQFAELASAVPASDTALVDALDMAMASGLLVDRGAGYAFSHPLYQLAVREMVGPARRARMHLRIAAALAGVEPSAPPGILVAGAASATDPLPVAEHALAAAEAGDRDALPLAVAFGFAAGERARILFDRTSATRLLERSLAAWRRLPPELEAMYPASSRYVSLIDLNTHVASHDAAATRAFRDAVATARDAGELAAAHAAYFWLPYRRGDFDSALEILEAGIRALPADAAVARALLRSCMGWCLVRLRRHDEAYEVLQPATAVLEASADRRGAMQALDFLGFLVRLRGSPEQGIAYLERSLRLAWELGDSRGEMLAEIHLAASLTRLGCASPARPHAARALEVARLMGDRYGEAVARWTAAEMEDLAGDLPAATAHRREELRLLTDVGGNPHNEALAHAHLANIAWRTDDGATFDGESAIAVGLAARSHDSEYPARIRNLLHASDWWRMEA